MAYTISTHNGSAKSREHNIRKNAYVKNKPHIHLDRDHEIWKDEKETEAYKRLFDEFVQEYNAKQKRSDRKIADYYKLIKADKVKHTSYEMIVAMGNVDNRIDEKIGKEILREFFEKWNERNPQLEMIGAYYHGDEDGVPHLHIDYIPVATGYSKGMRVQTGLAKALEQQMNYKALSPRETAQIEWERRENAFLEKLCNARGIEIEHPERGGKVQHQRTEVYKLQKEGEKLRDELAKIKKTVEKTEEKAANGEVKRFGQTIMVKEDEYKDLMKAATLGKDILKAEEKAREIVADAEAYKFEVNSDRARKEAKAKRDEQFIANLSKEHPEFIDAMGHYVPDEERNEIEKRRKARERDAKAHPNKYRLEEMERTIE